MRSYPHQQGMTEEKKAAAALRREEIAAKLDALLDA
jgi:hypothetical protein